MSTAIIIMAAGEAHRFKGRVKALLEVDGVKLIDRTIHLVRTYTDAPIYVRTQRAELAQHCFQHPGVHILMDGPREFWVQSVLSTRPYWADFNVVLQGDVYYSKDCMGKIMGSSEAITYFRDGGTETRETFAVTFCRYVADKYAQYLHDFVRVQRTKNTIKFYQYLLRQGMPVTTVIVRDKTQDFDTPKDLARWRDGQYKYCKKP